jgi:hypothetical protein
VMRRPFFTTASPARTLWAASAPTASATGTGPNLTPPASGPCARRRRSRRGWRRRSRPG